MKPKLIKPSLSTLGLTPREEEVLLLISEGLTGAGISRSLNISKRTVEGHTASIFKKLGVKTRTGAAMKLYKIKNKRENTDGMDQHY